MQQINILFTVLLNHHHCLIPEHFHYHERKLHIHSWVTTHSPDPQALADYYQSVYSWIFHINRIILNMVFCVWCFVSNFSLSIMFPRIYMLYTISVLHFFLWLDCIQLCRYTTLCLSIYKLINIYVAYIFLTILNSTDMNIHV